MDENADDTRARWPAGHRSAVIISIDIDGDTWLRREYGEHRVGKRALGAYDLSAGIPRVLRLLADYGVLGTFFWVGQVAEGAPELVRRCAEEGHEIACHTWDHAHYDDVTDERQRDDLRRTRDMLAVITGTPPVGHKSAGFAPGAGTPAILQSLGFLYQMDLASGDLPWVVRPDAALPPLIQLPPTTFLDDYTLFADNLLAPDDAFALCRTTVDLLRDDGGLACFTFHPHLMGQPAPSRVFTRLLEYIIDLGDVWIDRADHVATWWRDRGQDTARNLDPARRTRNP